MLGPGSLIASRYEILSALGAGGMGVVYKAHDRVLDETVALKVLRSELPFDPDREKRFRSEIKLAWKVRHRNVCGIHEYGEDGDLRYISMELVEGNDLKQALREHGPLPWDQAFDVAIQTAEGLQAIHDVGIIHRDLKTANLIRDARGLVRLMDFGIAKQWTAGGGITQAGQVVGSPEYMSPEQVWGHALDFRSDLYSLGIVVFELFTGHVPFAGDTPISVMLKHLHELPPLDSADAFGLPPALLPSLRKALAKDVAERPASARAMADELGAARASSLPAGRPPVVASLPARTGPAPAPVPAAQGASAAAPRLAESVPRRTPEPRLLIPPLLRALRHDDRDIRTAAAEALGRMGPEAAGALAALVKALADPWPGVRVQVVRALGKLGPEARSALPSLSEVLADPDERVRAAASRTVARLETPSEPLDGRLPDPPGGSPEAPSQPPLEAPAEDPGELPTEIRAVPTPRLAAGEGASDSRPSFLSQMTRAGEEARPPRPRVLSRRVRHRLLVLSRPSVLWTLLAVGVTAYLLARSWRPPDRSSEAASAGVTSLVPPGLPAPPGSSETPADIPTPHAAAPTTTLPVPTPSPSATAAARLRSAAGSPLRARNAEASAIPDAPNTAPTASPEPLTTPSTSPGPPEPTLVVASELPSPSPPSPSPLETPPPAPAVQHGELVRIDDPGVVAPRPRLKPRPGYPDLALRLQQQGDVVLALLVDEQGRVAEVRVESGPKTLAESSRASALKWTFWPATKAGVPVKVWIRDTVSFRLR